MEKLDPILTGDLESVIEHAKEQGRFQIADYLSLRASNDQIRTEAVDWLHDTVREIVFAFNRHGAKIQIEHFHKQRIKYGSSELSGERMVLRLAIRCLTIESGWTRSSFDGFMRGGALAFARISHFGHQKGTEELELLKFEGKPQWFGVRDEKTRDEFNVSSLRKHFEVLLK